MSDSKPRRKLAAILVADVVGFSRMMGADEDRTLRNLKACRVIIDDAIASNRGRIFGSAGDSVIAEFASPVDASSAAVEFQRNLRDRNGAVPPEDQMLFRVGLNLGDVIAEGDNLFGDGVNVAARLEPLAEPGGILVSGKFHEEVRRKLDLGFVDKGSREMKNIEEPVPTFKVLLGHEGEEEATPSPAASSPSAPAPEPSPAAEAKVPAIAVLPFTNMGGDPEQEYFADGITEDIITNLSLWRTFPVISRNSSFAFRGQGQNLKQVASELGARYIVEGSVRKGGNRVRITAQLIDADEDHHLWSEKWDRTLEDIFEVQDEVSEAIAARVAPAIAGKEQSRIKRNRPDNLSAWEKHLQGLRCFHERPRTDYEDAGLTEAKLHLKAAIAEDDSLADAHAHLALCSAVELVQRLAKDRDQAMSLIFDHARKAISLEAENTMALSMLSAYYMFNGEIQNCHDYAQRAVKSNPSHVFGHQRLGMALNRMDRFEQAEPAFQKALKLSPVDPEIWLVHVGCFYAFMGQAEYQNALGACDRALAANSKMGNLHGFRAAALGHLERFGEAQKELALYLEARPNLKTREDFHKLFFRNWIMTDILIEGLIKAGWEPED